MKLSKDEWRRLKFAHETGVSKKKLCEVYSLSYNTLRHYINLTEGEFDEALFEQTPAVEMYREEILQLLRINPQVSNASLFWRMKDEYPEFSCSLQTFQRFMKKTREELGGIYQKKRIHTIREDPPPGYEAQVDFGQYNMTTMYGNKTRVYFFVMTLAYSRMHYVYFSARPFNTHTAIEAHDYAFRFFGGRTETIMYDQDRVFVVDENAGNIVLAKEFENYVRDTGFSVVLCRPKQPNTKGKVEALVKFVKMSFLDGRIYSGITELNAAALRWLDIYANKELHRSTRRSPQEMFLADEAKLLKPVKHVIRDRVEIRVVSDKYTASFAAAKYELPWIKVAPGDHLRIEQNGDILFFYKLPDNELIYKVDRHPRGARVPCVSQTQQAETRASIKMKINYDNINLRDTFMVELKNAVGRYYNTHLQHILKMTELYEIDQMEEAMEHCLSIARCTAFEVGAYLICNYNGVKIKDHFKSYFYYDCLKRAKELRGDNNAS